MISSQILQNTIDELHGITRVDFAVMDTEGNEVATTMQPDFILPQAVVQFADSPADSQVVQYKAAGIVLFLGGSLLPLLLLGVLFYFRMLGAGDIKLFCVVGGFLGAMDLLKCMLAAVVFGAVWSSWILWKRHLWTERFGYFMQYTATYAKERHWKSYLDGVGTAGRICFSLPILASVLCYMGGWI